jgi:hypothetical protein
MRDRGKILNGSYRWTQHNKPVQGNTLHYKLRYRRVEILDPLMELQNTQNTVHAELVRPNYQSCPKNYIQLVDLILLDTQRTHFPPPKPSRIKHRNNIPLRILQIPFRRPMIFLPRMLKRPL